MPPLAGTRTTTKNIYTMVTSLAVKTTEMAGLQGEERKTRTRKKKGQMNMRKLPNILGQSRNETIMLYCRWSEVYRFPPPPPIAYEGINRILINPNGFRLRILIFVLRTNTFPVTTTLTNILSTFAILLQRGSISSSWHMKLLLTLRSVPFMIF